LNYSRFLSCFLALCLAALAPVRASRLLPEIRPTLLRLFHIDAPHALPVEMHEVAKVAPGAMLFLDLPVGIRMHPSYDLTYNFCQKFDPMNRVDDEVSDADIREYLRQIQGMAPIQEAFRVTRRRTVEDMAAIWFRRGRGFEHVVCGESGSHDRTRLGGYHFWYMHYRYEREGRAHYLGSDYGRASLEQGMADNAVVTGQFSWDPDGPEGPLAPMSKRPRGGFTVGHSVAAILAAGHIAYYGAEGKQVEINLNGKAYPWTFYRRWRNRASSIRTLWPRFVPGPSRRGCCTKPVLPIP
jgi:hypothetical protein